MVPLACPASPLLERDKKKKQIYQGHSQKLVWGGIKFLGEV